MLVGIADERLRGEVEDEVRLDAEKGFFYGDGIAHVANFMPDRFCKTELLKRGRRGCRRQRKAVDVCAQFQEPLCQP